MLDNEDKEITLGTGRLLGLFFGLVVVCALFFSVGYSLGRGAGRVEAAGVAAATLPSPAPVATSPEGKPSPARTAAAKPVSSDELTFYKAVGQNQPSATLQPTAPPPDNAASAAAAPAPAPAPPPEQKPAVAGPGYLVQVAAVSKQQDAEALVAALQKKQYPVFITTNPPADKLFHVQVGPFSDLKGAEAMKARLAGDGYNPIVKK
jgi:DedD protein